MIFKMAMEPSTTTVSHPAKSFGKKSVGMPLIIVPSIMLMVDAIFKNGRGMLKVVSWDVKAILSGGIASRCYGLGIHLLLTTHARRS